MAINEAGIKPEDVDYVNAHQHLLMKGESGAIVSQREKKMFQFHLLNHFTNHLLGAAGALKLTRSNRRFVTCMACRKLLLKRIV